MMHGQKNIKKNIESVQLSLNSSKEFHQTYKMS